MVASVHLPEPAAGAPTTAHADPVHAELHRRIDALLAHPDDDFGTFHALDWVLIVTGCVLLPVLLYLAFLP